MLLTTNLIHIHTIKNTFYKSSTWPKKESFNVPTTLIAKNLMQAHLWGLKSMYYSLIDKQGSKADAEEVPTMLEPIDYEEEADCSACKL